MKASRKMIRYLLEEALGEIKVKSRTTSLSPSDVPDVASEPSITL